MLKGLFKTAKILLLANKTRSFLTMLGIIIGVAAVILITALGAGAQSLILAQVKGLGSNLIGILPGKSETNGPPATVMGIVITSLTYDDMQALLSPNNGAHLVSAVGYSKGVGTVSWNSNSYDTNLSGSTVGYLETEGGEVANGRFFTSDEEQNLARVIVLGSTVKKELFGDSQAIGERVKIKKQVFEVIGVMKERGKVAFQDYDDQVFIPLKTMQKLINGVNYLSFIRAKVDNQANVDQAIQVVSSILRARHNIDDPSGLTDDFSVRSMAQALEALTTITDALRYFLAAMAALSLVVGGIGIMNIMLISVMERTREIGLRQAVGARRHDIVQQFLLEAVILTSTGGLLGIIFGIFLSWIAYLVMIQLGYAWEFSVSLSSIIIAAGISALVGVIFGLYPAYKASRLEPVKSLSYE
jgi:ABC-type antimicrobial peptide transport system permease subunit